MSTVEGYDLHVYCDDPEHEARALASHELWVRYSGVAMFGGKDRATAFAAARRNGWKFGRNLPGIPAAINGGIQARCRMCHEARLIDKRAKEGLRRAARKRA